MSEIFRTAYVYVRNAGVLWIALG